MESQPEWRVSAAQFCIQDMCEGQTRTKAFTLEPPGHDLIGKAGTPLWTPDSEPLALTLALCLDLNLTSQFLFPDFIRPLIHSFIHSFIHLLIHGFIHLLIHPLICSSTQEGSIQCLPLPVHLRPLYTPSSVDPRVSSPSSARLCSFDAATSSFPRETPSWSSPVPWGGVGG